MTAPPGRLSGEFAGRYTIDRELGRGATAIVYLARDLEYGRAVAIKVLRTELAESVTADRFLREINLTAQLHHPHIVPVLGSGEFNGNLFFTLPFMDGGTLRDRLQRDKQLPVEDVVAIGKTILSALAHAHSKNLLHRDVKPENILFTGGQACLSDFGIARAIERVAGEMTTSTGLVRGTPAYMSPEQAAGNRDYDGRSDLYSLACVLYEALAGVPAFVGATPQAVIAQRITHEPRPVRVFRPSVTEGLEAVLVKALAAAPADRYQTAEEFAAALGLATMSTATATADVRPSHRRLGAFAAAAAIVVVAGVWAARVSGVSGIFRADVPPDTMRLAVFPFTSDSNRAEDLLYEGLRRWRGLRLVESFEIGDALRRRGTPASLADAQRLARELGAGRLVRGQLNSVGGRRVAIAALFGLESDRALHEVRATLPADSSDLLKVFRDLGDSLMLRSRKPDGPIDTSGVTTSLPATQVMIRAGDALRDWDLPRAESLYVQALAFDPTSARAALWVAQLRVWREAPRTAYAELAHRALMDSTSLVGDERSLAPALAALSDADYPKACSLYQAMTKQSPRQFAAWYGLGRCYDLDRLVVPDSTSPTKWRFRSSYNAAIDAFTRAFDVLPSVYQSYQGAAFSRVRSLLFTSPRNRRPGRAASPNNELFLAAPILDHDTLVFWPRSVGQVQLAQSTDDQRKIAAAIGYTRAKYRRIATGWATAFPMSAGAKEALAISLEIEADPASVDSLQSALRLAHDPNQRLRIQTEIVWARVKFSLPDDTLGLWIAANSVDSLLKFADRSGAESADYLGRLAALGGRCALLGPLARTAANPILVPVPQTQATSADVAERTALASLGCALTGKIASLDQIAERAHLSSLEPQVRELVAPFLFARVVRVTDGLDTNWAKRLAGRDPVVAAGLDLSRGQSTSARSRLETLDRILQMSAPGAITADAAFPEARVWLALADTIRVNQALDRVLMNLRISPPMDADESVDNVVIAGSLVRAMILKAQTARDAAERQRWAHAVTILWKNSDAELQSTIARMQQIAK